MRLLSLRAPLLPLALLLAGCLTSPADDVLFIGNSYTQGASSLVTSKHGGVPKLFEEIAEAKGKTVTTGIVAVGGKDWEFHLAQPKTIETLKSKPWNWVVIQNESNVTLKSGSAAFVKMGEDICAEITKDAPGAKVVVYETWARPPAFFKSKPDPAAAAADMLKGVQESSKQMAAKVSGVSIAPVGTAFGAIEGQGTDLHAPDAHHANDNGYYLAALIIYRTIYHESVMGAPAKFFNGALVIPEAEAKKLQEEAEAVVTVK